MDITKTFLKNIIDRSPVKNKVFQRNILKEYLQVIVLDFIYSHKEYSKLIFYGGSCLSHCYDLPRLSEDLDFVDLKKEVKIASIAKDIEKYFKENTDIQVKVVVQKFRAYLKFPILWELGLSSESESNLLFLKVEIFSDFSFCNNFTIEIKPLFKYNKSILVKTFDLSTLMSTKIRAILFRKWEKTDKLGNILVKAKGRDYFDLMWYLEKNIKPNINCIGGYKNKEKLKSDIKFIIQKLDVKSIEIDLESLISDNDFVKNVSKNLRNILLNNIEKI